MGSCAVTVIDPSSLTTICGPSSATSIVAMTF